MKRFILILCILVNSTPAQAGFLGTFFANVASDSLQNKNNGRYTSDPLIKEKKIQAALAVMGFYEGELDGDFDTFESRTGIKKFQVDNNLDETGFLSEEEKSQLAYLSNLYVDLKTPGIKKSKLMALYNEIDITLESMRELSFLDEYVPFFNDGRILLVTDMDDADVYIDGDKVGNTTLGYFRQKIGSGDYTISLKYVTPSGLASYSGSKNISLNSGSVTVSTLKIKGGKKQTGLHGALKSSDKVFFDNKSGLFFLDDMSKRYSSLGAAKKFCKNLSIEGATNWRVPTDEELKIMRTFKEQFKDYRKVMNHKYPMYWSSTKTGSNTYRWMSFKNHKTGRYYAKEAYHFRCVTS